MSIGMKCSRLFFQLFLMYSNYFQQRKIQNAEEFLKKIEKSQIEQEDGIIKIKYQINSLCQKLDEAKAIENSDDFDSIKDYLSERLTSFACAKHQGYIISNFELNSEMASALFLDDQMELNELTKPDYVIIINRSLEIDEQCLEIGENLRKERNEEIENENLIMQMKLKSYQ